VKLINTNNYKGLFSPVVDGRYSHDIPNQ